MAVGCRMGRSEIGGLLQELERIEKDGDGDRPVDRSRRHEVEERLLGLFAVEPPEHDRRQFIRLAVNRPVEVRTAAAAAPGMVLDFSPGGLFVRTQLAASVGDQVELEVAPYGGYGMTRARGTVVWSTADRSGRTGIGIAFAVLDAPMVRQVERLVLDCLRQRLGAA